MKKHIQIGTYLREPDGALFLYHIGLTSLNFPLENFRDNHPGTERHNTSSLYEWRRVHKRRELLEFRDHFGTWLGSGEYVIYTGEE